MSVTLINGDGNPRVLASQDADWYGALTGQTTCIVPINDNLGATIADSNTIEISSGVCITKEGRRVQIDEGGIEEIIIPTGTQGVDTYYIIGFHLYINELGQQVAETFVETMASATDTITETTFKEGSSSIYVSLYRVKRSGLLMDSVTRIIPILRTIAELDNTLGTTDISAIGDGTVTGGISQLNSDLADKSFTVTASNQSINLTSFDCKRFGSMGKLSIYGTTVRQLDANKAYFIPNLYIDGMQNVGLYGCGITRTVSGSSTDGADSFPCVVSVSGHSVCFTPLVTIPNNYGMAIELLCYLL